MTDMTAAELLKKRDSLQKEVAQLQQQAAVAKADETRIREELTTALGDLKTTHGCSSYEEAVAKRDSLIEELTTMLDDLEGLINAVRS